jgi:hypothetical protein
MKKYIIKSKTHGRHEVLLDDEDYEWASKYKWQVNPQNNPNYKGPAKFYVVRSASIKGKKKNFSLHREITKCPKGLQVDHINGNPLDNRKENLRVCTPKENSLNKTIHNRTGYIGVRFYEGQQRPYESRVNQTTVGYYRTAEEAALKHDEYKKEIYGEDNKFVKLNFPEGIPECVKKVIEESRTTRLPMRKNNTSGYFGMSYEKSRPKKPWRACINHKGKLVYVGNFVTKEIAARARDKKAVELYGENYPRLNFPNEYRGN